jgi:Haem degrading protein HbpS-like
MLFTPTQPGQFLWGLHQSNPVDPSVVYGGPTGNWGTADDPMVGQIPGGVNTFGGGITLWNTSGALVGAIGVSGDTSCADHNIALRVRDNLVARGIGLGNNKAGQYADNIIYDIVGGVSASGFGHPDCPGTSDDVNETITGIVQPAHDAFPF